MSLHGLPPGGGPRGVGAATEDWRKGELMLPFVAGGGAGDELKKSGDDDAGFWPFCTLRPVGVDIFDEFESLYVCCR